MYPREILLFYLDLILYLLIICFMLYMNMETNNNQHTTTMTTIGSDTNISVITNEMCHIEKNKSYSLLRYITSIEFSNGYYLY